jgi:hypothetical protein
MKVWWRLTAIGVLAAGMMLALGSSPGMAQSRAHVYLLRGLMNIFSLGMDTLAKELDRRGVYTTVENYSEWETLANQAAAKYRAGTEGPIILIGHSLGADAVMQMADYLGRKGIPVALVVPFDGTESFSASANVARVLNLTKHYYMSRGPGFHGSLINVDLSSNSNIDHLNIDKSPRLHAQVIGEVLAIVGGNRAAAPRGPKPTTISTPAPSGAVVGTEAGPAGAGAGADAVKPERSLATPAAPGGRETAKPEGAPPSPAKTGDGAIKSTDAMRPVADSGTPIIALPEHRATRERSDAAVAPPPPGVPTATSQPLNSAPAPN